MNPPLIRLSRVLLPALTLALTLVVGCQRYRAKPLTPEAVQASLTPPPLTALQARARDLAREGCFPPVILDPRRGLTPDAAAVLAALVNPTLRADRNRLALSSAQLFQAGLLPNPQFTASDDFITSGPGVVNPFGIGVNWDVTTLITHETRIRAARATQASIRLDVAWVEWQAAEGAKAAVYDLASIQQQLAYARAVDQRLAGNLRVIQGAVDRHERTLLDLSAAATASQTAHADALALEQQLARQRLVLLRAIGLPPATQLTLDPGVTLPGELRLPNDEQLTAGLESQRLDLIALRHGYDAEEQNVRVAILQQFPRINIGPTRTEDNTGVHTVGFAATVDLPLFDRNQGMIAAERATRQKLFDEYVSRVFQARVDVAMLLADIRAVMPQIAAATAAIPDLRQLVETYRIAVDQGNADVLSYYTAQNDLAQKEIALVKLKQGLVDDKIALEIAVGRYLPDVTALPTTQPTQPVERASAEVQP
jgi:outer membrane protein TolC